MAAEDTRRCRLRRPADRALEAGRPPRHRPGLHASRPAVRTLRQRRHPCLQLERSAPRQSHRAQALPARQHRFASDVAVGGILGDGASAALDGGGLGCARGRACPLLQIRPMVRRGRHPVPQGVSVPRRARAPARARSKSPDGARVSAHLLGRHVLLGTRPVPQLRGVLRRDAQDRLCDAARQLDREDPPGQSRQESPRRFCRALQRDGGHRGDGKPAASHQGARRDDRHLDPVALRDRRRLRHRARHRRHGGRLLWASPR